MTIPVEPTSFLISDSSHAGEARRAAAAMTTTMGFDATTAGKVSIVVTELANNLHRHAKQGEIILQPLQTPAELGIEILAIDHGPGMTNMTDAMRDGFSTGGTSGTGLGAVRRMAHEFDAFTESQRGTAVMARFWPRGKPVHVGVQVGVVCLPKAGEDACGDAWAMVADPQSGRSIYLIADGLGHGSAAAQASRRAVELFREHADRTPLQLIELLHGGLRGTRGAAVAVTEILRGKGRVNFAGLGNVVAAIHHGLHVRNMVSHNGTAGAEARRMQGFAYEWTEESLLIMHSDGLAQHWSLANHRGLIMRCPSTIASVLYRDHRRVRDDVTVLVARETPAG